MVICNSILYSDQTYTIATDISGTVTVITPNREFTIDVLFTTFNLSLFASDIGNCKFIQNNTITNFIVIALDSTMCDITADSQINDVINIYVNNPKTETFTFYARYGNSVINLGTGSNASFIPMDIFPFSTGASIDYWAVSVGLEYNYKVPERTHALNSIEKKALPTEMQKYPAGRLDTFSRVSGNKATFADEFTTLSQFEGGIGINIRQRTLNDCDRDFNGDYTKAGNIIFDLVEIEESGYGIVIRNILVSPTGWTESDSYYVYTISDNRITSSSVTFLIPQNDYANIISESGWYPHTTSHNGYILIYANNPVTANCYVDLIVTKEVAINRDIYTSSPMTGDGSQISPLTIVSNTYEPYNTNIQAHVTSVHAPLITFYTQTSLNIDGNNGNFFLISISANASFTLSNIVQNVQYYFMIKNTGASAITVTLPNTADIKSALTVSIGASKTKELAMIYDNTNRYWQISEELT